MENQDDLCGEQRPLQPWHRSDGSAEGWKRANEGAERAYKAALDEWKEEAFQIVVHLCNTMPEWTTDDIWEAGLGPVKEARAMAGVTSRARTEGLAVTKRDESGRKVAVRSRRATRNAGWCGVWISQVYGTKSDAGEEQGDAPVLA
jgi:hypothetical protein